MHFSELELIKEALKSRYASSHFVRVSDVVIYFTDSPSDEAVLSEGFALSDKKGSFFSKGRKLSGSNVVVITGASSPHAVYLQTAGIEERHDYKVVEVLRWDGEKFNEIERYSSEQDRRRLLDASCRQQEAFGRLQGEVLKIK